MADVKQFSCIDVKLASGSVANAVNFGSLSNIVGLFVFTSKKIGLHVNGAGSTEIECGSVWAALDTSITSLHIDNDLQSPAAEQIVEVWLATKT